jgi:hypothetical protein
MLSMLLLIFLSSACAPTLGPSQQHRLRVVDAESGLPIPKAQIALHYFPSVPESPAPEYPQATADDEGSLTIESSANPLIWQVQAPGYIEQQLSANGGNLPRRYAAHAANDNDGVIHLYSLPEPQLTLVIDDAYTGTVTINLQPAAGFDFVPVDEINVTFAAVNPQADYVQGEPAQRTFTETASAQGAVDLVVTPLLYDIQTEQVQIQDSSGLLPHQDFANPDHEGRGVWGAVSDDDKRLYRQIRLFVGTQADYQAFLQSAP